MTKQEIIELTKELANIVNQEANGYGMPIDKEYKNQLVQKAQKL